MLLPAPYTGAGLCPVDAFSVFPYAEGITSRSFLLQGLSFMKLSLNWLFDYIDTSLSDLSVPFLVTTINQKIAEVEHWSFVSLKLDALTFIKTHAVTDTHIVGIAPSTEQTYTLPARTHAKVGDWLLIAIDNDTPRWATVTDFGGSKETLLPPFYLPEQLYAGEWRKFAEQNDYYIEIDNKSITHRPDLWCHYGFARDIAAALNVPLKPFAFDRVTTTIHEEIRESYTKEFNIIVESDSDCSHFSSLFVPFVHHKASVPWMAMRLARIDAQPINALVDCGNYVMFDIGQPMHLYDANTIPGKTIRVQKKMGGKKLTLLDGSTTTLTDDDIVIVDDRTPLALAGVMGGLETAITETSTALFIEAAHFNGSTIRKAAAHHKKRTDASMRFEKEIDPYHTANAIERFLTLCDQIGLPFSLPYPIITIGKREPARTVSITHQYIEERLGVVIETSFVRNTLRALGFEVHEQRVRNEKGYLVKVPSFRFTKDVAIPEDIIEEVGRCLGYNTIPLSLPRMAITPHATPERARVRTLKKLLAFKHGMHEIYQHSLYDESFLHAIDWKTVGAVEIANPVSENWRTLVTSLMPHLLKAVLQNSQEYADQRFFEWGRAWHVDKNVAIEQKRLAGILFHKKAPLTYYDGKFVVESLFNEIGMTVEWQRIDAPTYPWLEQYQSATIWHNGKSIGVCGMIAHQFLAPHTEGAAFIFELDGDALLAVIHEPRYQPLSKFPVVERDISVLLPLRHTASEIQHLIAQVDKRITTVSLVDFFQKEEWGENRALTFRVILSDHHKTLTKEDIDSICTAIQQTVTLQGATLR